MAKGTTFGTIHSNRDLHLIQQKVDIQPAQPKLNLIDIPGADGSKDLSDRPAGRIVYHDRTLTWTFALYPGENWHEKHRQVSAALNGKRLDIYLDDDPNYFYTGRLTVKKYNTDKLLRQITVEATCSPYMLKRTQTSVPHSVTGTSVNTMMVTIGGAMPVIPTITVPAAATITFKGYSISIPSGTTELKGVLLLPGSNSVGIKFSSSGTRTVTLTYREGAL